MAIGWLDAPGVRSPVSSDPLFKTTRCVMPSTLCQTTIWPAGNVAGFGENDCAPLSRTMSIVTMPFDVVGAGGFDGASASLAGSESIGDFGSVNAGATAWAGVGAKADVDAGFKNGEFSFHFGAGLALGLGLEYDWGFSINFAEIGDSLYNVAADTFDCVGDAGEWVGGAAEDVADWVGDAAETIGDTAEDVMDAVGDAAGDVADTVGDAADSVGDAISDVFDW